MSIDQLIDGILDSYDRYGAINRAESENFPNSNNVIAILKDLESLIFPGFKNNEDLTPQNIRYITGAKVNNVIAMLTKEIQKALYYVICTKKGSAEGFTDSHCYKLAQDVAAALIEELPNIKRKMTLDTKAAFDGDPAATSCEEVILSYPGLYAILIYRFAHFLRKAGVPIIPRIACEYAHTKTGIDINPGAVIGESFFIDHGTGVVIGETCVIGRGVKLYQGVTLGALSVDKHMTNTKRHPTIEDNVTIYANSTILGGDTIIGHDSTIGGNTWVTSSIPPYTTLVNRQQND